MACSYLKRSPVERKTSTVVTNSKSENSPTPTLSCFSLNEIGGSSAVTSMTAPLAVVQPRCISFQNFALCEIAERLQSPHGPHELQVRLHYIRICTKKGRKARRREGDKCFLG